ncbi:hypothetical protein Q428_05710 [Fervidicella metallireducens AeB]|uniref:Lipoprotein n=1 Tax=Fervidicella metallireducens AeB TaxID=1403537 RepID=A0A017RWT5_9CLOT|nr:hypothetical protein [Fervidicella metallireducens]EYE88869.1 hypothetical protein Q428_05710 [Fervidicella metallireducens AeB]
MKRLKKLLSITVISIFILTSIGCTRKGELNSDAQGGLEAFNKIVKAYPEKKGFHKALQHWGFKLPTGEKFEWTKNMGANKADFAMVILADPFINAGLDVNKLDKNGWIFKPSGIEEGVELPNLLIKPYNVSDKNQNSNGSEDALRRILKENEDLVVYDKGSKFYKLNLGDGNEVQWVKELGSNNADIIFVLKAEPLIKAGLDINKIQESGWKLKKTTDDTNGIGITPDLLIKTFKLK